MFIDNNLYAIHKDKKTHIKGYLDDYVLLITALLNFLSIQWDKNIFNMCISLSTLLIKKFNILIILLSLIQSHYMK